MASLVCFRVGRESGATIRSIQRCGRVLSLCGRAIPLLVYRHPEKQIPSATLRNDN